jgi:dihydroorotase
MLVLIKGGRVIDPPDTDDIMDIVVENSTIREVAKNISADLGSQTRVIDATGKIVAPGFIDMHVHLREPGYEYKETIQTGAMAAAYGGFTAVCAMPNTNPVNDSREVTEYILKKARKAGFSRVYPVGAVSRGSEGKILSEYNDLKSAGVVALSDDGRPVTNSLLMRRALEYAKVFDLPVISHCEDMDLVANGAMNEGYMATRMGLPGIPNQAESIMVMRDIALCELTGSPVHIAHVSTRESVFAIRDAKKRGVPVTAETAPHYFTLTHESVAGYNTYAKMNPPLRAAEDLKEICKGLADGTIDVIATDHAPHCCAVDKDVEFEYAANGISGLETAVALSLQLVKNGVITMAQLVEKMSKNPASILKINNGLKPGAVADITIIDPDSPHTVDASLFKSLGRNTPFNGMHMTGMAVLTMVAGNVVFSA